VQAAVKRNVFEVFAQIEPGGPISHIGNLNAPGIDLAKVYARRIYDEERWSEMWVVPRAEIAVAHPDDTTPFDLRRAGSHTRVASAAPIAAAGDSALPPRTGAPRG
jgi:1,2-phenylacetyl-CoA epoxidase PaaB subunit